MNMPEQLPVEYIWIYLIGINSAAVIAAIADKLWAKESARRIPERHLLLLGALGGAAGEWLIMLIIRHKTRRAKFMVLLPLLTVLHIVLLGMLFC